MVEQKKSEKVIFDILITIAIVVITALILSKSYYKGFKRSDDFFGFLMLFGSIFINIGLSSGYKFKRNTILFFFISFIGYTIYLFWSFKRDIFSPDDTLILILIVEFLIALIYGIFYLIRKKDFTSFFNK